MATECADLHCKKLKMFGFGIPGQGFYSLEVPDAEQVEKFGGLISVTEGNATAEKLERELKNLIKPDWDFRVKELDRNEFSASFPDQISLNTFSKLTTVGLALYGYKVQISKTNIDPADSSVLHSTWIRIGGVPNFARKVEVIKEIASLVAEPIKVDEFSLWRDEPVRVRVNCRNPANLKGFVEIFFNRVGYEIKFWVEGAPNSARNRDASSGSGNQKDRKDGSDKRNEDNQDTRKMDKMEEPNSNLDKDLDASQGESQDDSMEDLIKDGSPMEAEFPDPIAVFHPELGLLQLDSVESPMIPSLEGLSDKEPCLVQQSQVLSQEEEIGWAQDQDLLQQKLMVHNAEGVYFMDKDKWPKLVIADEDINCTQDSTLEGQLTDEGGDQGWEKPPSRKKKLKSTKPKVTVATRASSRIPRDGIPVVEKAMKRAQERDELTGNPFTILNNASNDDLRKIALDLDINADFLDENLNAMKAEELVRADLAQANYKTYLSKLKHKEISPGEEDLQYLGLDIIDNGTRDMGGPNASASYEAPSNFS